MPDFNILNILKRTSVNNTVNNEAKKPSDVKTKDSIMNKYNTSNSGVDLAGLEQDYEDAESKVLNLTLKKQNEENEIQSNIDNIQGTKDSLSKNIEEKTTNISELTEQISVKNRALSELNYPDKAQYAKKEVDKEGKESVSYPGFQEACDEIDRQKQKIQDEIAELESKINTGNKELNDLQSNFDKAESQINSLEQDKNNIQNDGEIEQAQSEADTAKAKLDEGRAKQAQEEQEQINSADTNNINEISQAGAVNNNKNIEDDQKENKQNQTENSVMFEDSIIDNPPNVYSTKFVSNIKSHNNSISNAQYNALEKYNSSKKTSLAADGNTVTEINDTIFDVYENGNVVVTFSDGRNSIMIDAEGNETELETEVKEFKSGMKSVSYTLYDKDGNSYTKDNRYDKEGNFTNSITHLKNKDDQEIRSEHYDKFQNLNKTVEYEYDENGNKRKEFISNYNSSQRNWPESTKEIIYDENGNQSKISILKYKNNRELQSAQETQYEYDENGNQSKETTVTYDKNGDIESSQETKYEYDKNGNKNKQTVLIYDKNGELQSAQETQYEYDENGNKSKTTEITRDGSGNINSTKESQYENGIIKKTVETLFDNENGNQIINEYNQYNQLQKKTFLKEDAETGNTIKATTEYDSGKMTTWSQEIIDEKGEIISELNPESLISELNKKGLNITEGEAIKLGNFIDELSLEDIVYAVSNGYDKYLDNIVNYGGVEHIKDGRATSFVTNDYNKIIDAIKNRESVEETFCPTMDSEETALQDLNIGDTCVIDNKLYIKTDEGMEQLNMSREKYLELFPPSARFSINQQRSGDCYLLSALYSMEANPHTYANILRCFTENEDGSVTVKIPYKNINEKYNDPDLPLSERLENQKKDDYYVISEVTLTIPANGKMDDFYTPDTNYKGEGGPTYANACEGIRALEYLYGFCSINENIDNIFNELDAAIESGNQDEIERLNERIKEVTDKAELAKGSGGISGNVFLDFGLKCIEDSIDNYNESYIYTTATGASDENPLIDDIGSISGHAYGIRPFYDENGELKYEVVNPWHTSYSVILTYEELKETFKSFETAKP